jgi:hypothetical protein
MKKLLLAALVVALAFALTTPSNAQGKFYLNPGLDVYFPMGDFGNAVNVGFGGTVRGEYVFTKEISGTFAVGYDIWSGKSITNPIDGSSYSADFKGIPIAVGGKYYFMPEAAKTRVYGMIELGLFMASVTAPEIKDPITGMVYGGGSTSSTAFMFDPMVGAEFALGKVTLDAAVRYLLLAKDGSNSNFGLRVGVKFPIGG